MKQLITVIFLVLAVVAGINGEEADSLELEELIAEFLDWRLKEWPVYGTKFGLHQYNDRLDNYTEDAFTEQKFQAQAFLDRVEELHELAGQELVSVEVLKNLLENFIVGYDFRKYSIYNSIGPIEHVLSLLKKFITLMPTKTPEDYDNFLARYRLVPTQVREIKALMEIAVQEGLTQHSSSLDSVLSSLDTLLTQDTEDTLFYSPFLDSVMDPAFTDKTQMATVQDTARTLIEDKILPVLTEYRDYVRNEYSQHTRPYAGVGTLEGGQDYYQACLNWHLSVEMEPQEIHDLGLREVARIEKGIEEIMKADQFIGTLKEYKDKLLSDPENFFETGEEILEEYRRIIDLVHDKLTTILLHVPEAPLEVRESDSGVIGRYSEPPLDGSRPGIFWANVMNPDQKPKFNMWALALHEAEPGHHTQSSYAIENDLPVFRRAVEYIRYNAVPFNWAFQTAYSEGWALYAESLGEEMGIYTAPYALFGRYTSEIHRAVRLVVDTGIHAFNWTIEQAEDYMTEHTTLGTNDITNEVKRYVAWPGQACSYKIGELKITELRRHAEDELGDDFDLREFHDEILQVGAVPMSVLEKHIKDWVFEKQRYISAAPMPSFNAGLIACLAAAILTWQRAMMI